MKYFNLLILFILSAARIHAQEVQPKIELTAGGGIQSTDLRWSIAGNSAGASPNVLSEIKWQGISGPIIQGELKINVYGDWFLSGCYGKSFIKSGKADDTDYTDDNRRSPSYHANLDADEGSVNNYNILAGYQLINKEKLKLYAAAGYTSKNQHVLLLSHAEDIPGELNLRSTYDTRWRGVMTNITASYNLTEHFSIAAAIHYSQLKYQALADWNLVYSFEHPVSFKQKADGFSIQPSIAFRYHLTHHFAVYLAGVYEHAETGTGVDQLFLESGDMQFTRFNGAVSNSKSVTLGACFNF